MIAAWSSSVALVAQSLLSRHVRTVAIASLTPGAGVSVFTREVAGALVSAGANVVIVDFSDHIATAGPSLREVDVQRGFLWHEPVAQPQGFDLAEVPGAPDLSGLILNTPAIEAAIASSLADYDHVLLELAPLGVEEQRAANPWGLAAAADVLLLVCLREATKRQQLQEAARHLAQVGVSRTEIVLNERDYSSVAEEAGRAVRKIPFVGRALERVLRRSEVLR